MKAERKKRLVRLRFRVATELRALAYDWNETVDEIAGDVADILEAEQKEFDKLLDKSKNGMVGAKRQERLDALEDLADELARLVVFLEHVVAKFDTCGKLK